MPLLSRPVVHDMAQFYLYEHEQRARRPGALGHARN